MRVQGTFTVSMQAEPPYDVEEGVALGRFSFAKEFSGPLAAKSTVQMLGVRGPDPARAGYVAVERIRGTLEGREGSFVVLHMGVMGGAHDGLTLRLAPGSGTGGFVGIEGEMNIEVIDKVHHYTLDYTWGS